MEDETEAIVAPVKEKRTRPEKRKFDFEQNNRTIFVGNLPSNLDHRDVSKLFKACGPVESARIRSVVPEKEKLAPKVALITKRMHPKVDSVNAYVVFATNENDECVKKALSMNGKLIDGHHIRVDRAQRPKAKRETLTSRKKSIFVGNLRFDLRDDDLINHFEKVGSVNYVRIVRDRATGLGKGFGFVVFHERASVKNALELNDTDYKGRQLRIKKVEDESKDKSKNKQTKPTKRAAEKDSGDDDEIDHEVKIVKQDKKMKHNEEEEGDEDEDEDAEKINNKGKKEKIKAGNRSGPKREKKKKFKPHGRADSKRSMTVKKIMKTTKSKKGPGNKRVDGKKKFEHKMRKKGKAR